jgi:prepilin-type processing-associated H-X9-DG protein
MLSMHNHESAKKAFPSGGNVPWPRLNNYLVGGNGAPFGPDRQGMGWAFQILPYLEGNAVYNIKDMATLEDVALPFVNCPSKRGPTRGYYLSERGTGKFPYLMDYAAAVPFPSRGQWGVPAGAVTNPLYQKTSPAAVDIRACEAVTFWGGKTEALGQTHSIGPWTTASTFAGYWGVIVRSEYFDPGAREGGDTVNSGTYDRISFPQITDGSSNTLVIGEKRLDPLFYNQDEWHDDVGMTGGWDPDILRSTACELGPDRVVDRSAGSQDPKFSGFRFGSAHAGGMNAGFADASVRTINYEIEPEIFNRLGHRSDEEEPVTLESN